VTPGTADAFITSSNLNGLGDGWQVSARLETGVTGDFSVTARAVCATVSTP
jgi:hypothetical protein